ncbi:MAG TPA: vitamin K epoxide reductase family protein [Candidatus Sulfotelmatobacter sp.]|nr:vitamin K epoxide reductase family protein [Candidatus Sulfotelmatobacter sp.]
MQTAVRAGRNRILFATIAALSLAGVVDSAIALQRHYAKSATQFCDFRQQLNCDIVNRSEYSTIQGIPVAAIGILGYAALFLLSTLWKSRPETPTRLLVVSLGGFAFALYLTYIEAHELMTWCILCLVSQALIFLICALAVFIKLRSPQP